MVVQIVSVPFDLCGPHHGSRLGSLAMQLEGLEPGLGRLGVSTIVTESVDLNGQMPGARSECDSRALGVYESTKGLVNDGIRAGHLPLVIGGDHSIALGSIAGAVAACGSDLAVLWIDAHMDVNTPDTSPSGNLHGMPLAALAGLQPLSPQASHDPQAKPWIEEAYDLWPKLLGLVPEPGLGLDRIAWFGLRDVDPGEVVNLGRLPGSLALTMQDIDELGVKGALGRFKSWMQMCGATKLWISFDVDVLDPIYAPGTGTAVRGGLTYREGHLVAETLHAMLFEEGRGFDLVGFDVVEVNPLRDQSNETGRIATEWVFSLFGKTILHTGDPGRGAG